MNRLLADWNEGENQVRYVKEFRGYAQSVSGCILMYALELQFGKTSGGFSCQYDSILEKLECSIDEFHTAFKAVGARYKSKSDYQSQSDPFSGRLYCSYMDRSSRLVSFFRSQAAADDIGDMLDVVPATDPSFPVFQSATPYGVHLPKGFAPVNYGHKGEVVYLAEAEGIGRWKIGRTVKVKRREAELQRQSPVPIRIVHTIETKESGNLESRLHQRYAHARVIGEWFALSDAEVAEIKTMGGGSNV
jgi:Meiotically up-regulated gene 113